MMKEGWTECRLGDVCENVETVNRKKMPSTDSFVYLDIGGIDNKTNRIVNHKEFTWEQAPSRAQQIVKKGDVLFSTVRTYLKNIAAVTADQHDGQVCSSGFCVIRGKKNVLENGFIFYYCLYEGFLRKLNELQTGTSYPAVRDKDVFAQKIPLPPIDQQRAIVAKIEELFSELDNAIDNLKAARNKIDIYRQSVLKQAFTGELTREWRSRQINLPSGEELLAQIQAERQRHYEQLVAEWKSAIKTWEENGKVGKKPGKPSKVVEVTAVSQDELSLIPEIPLNWAYTRLSNIADIGSGMSVSQNRKPSDEILVPYLRVANVQRGHLNLKEIKYMPIEKADLPGLSLKKWDVLFNEGGDRDKLGRGWIWESQIEPCITQNHVFRASLHQAGKDKAKLISLWGNCFGRDYFERTGKQTTNLASINKSVLSMFPVPVMTEDEQTQVIQEIESRLSVCDNLSETIETSLQQAETLRQSIMKKAFEGCF